MEGEICKEGSHVGVVGLDGGVRETIPCACAVAGCQPSVGGGHRMCRL